MLKRRRIKKPVSKFRSGLEAKVAGILDKAKTKYSFEPHTIAYTVPESKHKYLPDFKVGTIYLEAKGYFDAASRKKMLHVVESNPDLKIWMVFSHPNKTISKRSTTTYAQWCDKKGLLWMDLEKLETLLKGHNANSI